MSSQPTYKYLGKPRKLVEGLEKVTGHAHYSADLNLPGMLYARPILSPYAHGSIQSIDKSAAEAVPGVHAVLTAEDLVTKDALIASRNSAILAKERVLWRGQPVAVVIAESETIAQDAADLVVIDYEPLPAVIDIEEAIQPDAPTIWPHGLPEEESDLTAAHGDTVAKEVTHDRPNNVHAVNHFERGNVQQGFAEADLVIEQTYRCEMNHQGYMEPHACVVQPDPLGRGITVYTGTQGQYAVQDELARILSMPKNQITVVPMMFGGGFGAKYGIVEPLVSAIALTLKQPIALVLNRSEDFLATTPAPAILLNLKTGVKRDGTLTALQAQVWLDNGIFSFNLGGLLAIMLGGYYKWNHLKIDCYEVNTHKPQIGSYRAPTAPQATFAIESNIDEMARQLELDPLEFRLQNGVETGDLTGIGKPWPQIGLKLCLERLREHPMWKNREKQPHEGIGLAIGGWPATVDPAASVCRVDSDGTVNIQLGTVDISGVNSTFVLVAAEVLGVSPDEVRIVPPDTRSSPFGPASGGSKTTYSTVGAIRLSAESAKHKLLAVAADQFEAAPEDIELVDSHAQVRGVPAKRIPIGKLARIAQSKRGGPGPIVGEGGSAIKENSPGFVAHLVKVTVDPETGRVQPLEYVSVQDVGFALNPMMVEGQLHGGLAQGIGLALHEAMIYDADGQLLTGSFNDYTIPRADDVPNFETILLENPSPHGPFGVRGVGEPPIIPGAAAIGNAIKDATDVRLTHLPMHSERVWRAMQEG